MSEIHVTRTPVDAAEEAASVRLATAEDRAELSEVFADGFFDDPVLSWVLREEASRRQQLTRAFDIFHRRFWAASDLTYTTGRLAGVCVWLAPGGWHSSIAAQVRAMPAMLRALGPGNFLRLMRLLNLMESNHPHEDHYYLPAIGVATDWQGKGLGSALMGPMLERCDRERAPAYLEASSERSRDLYLRHGFEITGKLTCPDDGPPLWPMWRAPGQTLGD